MSNTVYYEPITGGDNGVWGPKELRQNRLAMGVNSCVLYDDSGTLKLTTGQIGIVTPSKYAKAEIDTVTTISIAGLTVSLWAKIEMSISGSTPSFTAASIVGANDPATIPSEFFGAFVGAKGGFYVDSSKRCIGIVWIDSGGNLDGIVNGLPGINGYIGSSDSSDNAFNVINSIQNYGAAFSYDTVNKQYSIAHKTKIIFPTLRVLHKTAANTDGGATTTGAFIACPFNYVDKNTIVGASFDTGTYIATLPAGTYEIDVSHIIYDCNQSQLIIWDETSAAILISFGASSYGSATNDVITNPRIKTEFTLVSETNISIKAQVSSAKAASGFGPAANFGVENIFGTWEIRQIA
jgi:hypothetical protein